jgi:hypothetical protein
VGLGLALVASGHGAGVISSLRYWQICEQPTIEYILRIGDGNEEGKKQKRKKKRRKRQKKNATHLTGTSDWRQTNSSYAQDGRHGHTLFGQKSSNRNGKKEEEEEEEEEEIGMKRRRRRRRRRRRSKRRREKKKKKK